MFVVFILVFSVIPITYAQPKNNGKPDDDEPDPDDLIPVIVDWEKEYQELLLKWIEDDKNNKKEIDLIIESNPIVFHRSTDIIKFSRFKRFYPYETRRYFSIKLHNPAYGEDSQSLGQFVDNFDTTGNVSVTLGTRINTTSGVIELFPIGSPSSPQYENFTEQFSLTDPNNRLTLDDYVITALNSARGDESRATEDYGSGNIDTDTEFWFDWNITELNIGDGTQRKIVQLMVVTVTSNIKGRSNDELQFNLEQLVAEDNTKYQLEFEQWDGGAKTGELLSSVELNVSQEYYGIFNRTGNLKEWFIFSDSARTNLVDYLNITVGSDNHRFLHVFKQNDATGDPNDDFNGTFSNLWNTSKGSMGGVGSGYFISTNYLLDLIANGSTLVYMANTTIPQNTVITIQFSSDNSTWVNSKGVSGYNTLSGGFESIDLRDLNYTSGFYIMVNMSNTDGSSVPFMSQSRLITTEGNSTGAGGAVVSGWNPIFLIPTGITIVLISITGVFILGRGKRKK
jgi:hypothetical protein